MDADDPLSAAQGAELLRYVELTYRAVTEQRRRQAAVSVALSVIFGFAGLWAGSQWLATRNRVDRIRDEPLVEMLGVQVPDPRPAFERGELRMRSMLWGMLAAAACVLSLLAIGVYLLVRLPRVPAPATPTPTPSRDPPAQPPM